MNGVTIDCSLDLAVHPAQSDTVLLTIPGVDGSLDGYKNKYVRIAEEAQKAHKVGVVRISNPFITSFHWESNPRHALQYIQDNIEQITYSVEPPNIKVVAHSAGASILGRIAHEYDTITDILLINPAQKLDAEAIRSGLQKTKANVTVVFGEKDPSVGFAEQLSSDGHRMIIVDNADHYFSNEHLMTFMELPTKYLL